MAFSGNVNTELFVGMEKNSVVNNQPVTSMETDEDQVDPSLEARTYTNLQQQPAMLGNPLILTGSSSKKEEMTQRDPALVCASSTEQMSAVTGKDLNEKQAENGCAVAVEDTLADSVSELVREERNVSFDCLNNAEQMAATEEALPEDNTARGLLTVGDIIVDSKPRNEPETVSLDCLSNTEQMMAAAQESSIEENRTSRGYAFGTTIGDTVTQKQTAEVTKKIRKEDQAGGRPAAVIGETESSERDREADVVDDGPDSTAIHSAALDKALTPSVGKEKIDIQLQCPECSAANDFYICEGTLGENIEAGERVRLHAGAVPMHCKHCDARFGSCFGIVRPIKDTAAIKQKCRKSKDSSKGVEKPYKCPHCDKSFNYHYSFKVHMQAHTGERALKCSECGAAFRRPHRLYEHLKASHSDSVTLVKCQHCPKHFTSTEALNEHTLLHTMERPYSCVYCPSAFKTRFDRDRHALIHTGERPYKCNQCSAAFKRPFSLTQHIRSKHTEAGRKPARQPSLKPRKKYTRRNDTRERPFKCLECDCAYMTAQKLKDHTILKHNAVANRKTYSCHMCDAVFRKISDLNVHIKSHW